MYIVCKYFNIIVVKVIMKIVDYVGEIFKIMFNVILVKEMWFKVLFIKFWWCKIRKMFKIGVKILIVIIVKSVCCIKL